MENNTYSDELQHWGIKGMKWGVRRYQNSDGTLTKAGQKRYNKEVEKLKKETAKVKEAEKIAANRKKTQGKLDKLEEKKQALEERKKALKNGEAKSKEKTDETPEQRKERLLKSVDAKELYTHKDELSTFELNERINRIDTEARLKSKIVEEHKKTGMDYMDDTRNKLDKATNLFRSVDNAYSTVANSAIGKTLAKKLGIEPPKEEFNLMKTWQNRNKLTTQEMMDLNKRLTAEDSIADKIKARNNAKAAEKQAKEEAKAAEKQAKEAAKAEKQAQEEAAKAEKQAQEEAAKVEKQQQAAQKQVDDYNERWQKGDSNDKVTSKNDSSANAAGQRDTTKSYRIEDVYTERVNTDGNIYGEGKSKFTGWDKKVTNVDAEEGKDFWSVSSSVRNTPTSNLPSTEIYSIGRSYLLGTYDDD